VAGASSRGPLLTRIDTLLADDAREPHSAGDDTLSQPAPPPQVDEVEDAEFVRMAGDAQYTKYVRQIRIDWREATGCALTRLLPSLSCSISPRSHVRQQEG
jgi:hypothetical protein